MTAPETGAGIDQDALVDRINATETGLRVVSPQSKRLACGDVGVGAMADVEVVVAAVGGLLPS